MKILFQYYNGGGGALENILVLLTRLAKDNPNDEYVIVCNKESKLNQLSVIKNVNVIIPKEYYHREITRLQLGLWGLRKMVNDLRPDIVWSMNLGSYVKLNVVNILSINNSHQVYPMADTKSHPKSQIHVLLLRFFFRLSLALSDRVLTQTEVIKGYVKKISPNKKVSVFTKVVENNQDVTECIPPIPVLNKLNNIKSTPLLYIASNYKHKNHRVIIDAVYLLAKKGEDVTLILSLTEKEVISIGGERALDLIKSQRLCCLGWVEKSWLKYLYDFSYLCLMPSILESQSSSHLEAMAWGVPQISSDLAFARETCKKASLYCEPNDIESWCTAIITLIKKPSVYKKLQNEGFARINEFPKDWSEVALSYHNMFKNELNRKV